jgi:hypothetical protein
MAIAKSFKYSEFTSYSIILGCEFIAWVGRPIWVKSWWRRPKAYTPFTTLALYYRWWEALELILLTLLLLGEYVRKISGVCIRQLGLPNKTLGTYWIWSKEFILSLHPFGNLHPLSTLLNKH